MFLVNSIISFFRQREQGRGLRREEGRKEGQIKGQRGRGGGREEGRKIRQEKAKKRNANFFLSGPLGILWVGVHWFCQQLPCS